MRGSKTRHEMAKSFREFSGKVQAHYGQAIKGYKKAPAHPGLLLDKRDREYLQELFTRGVPPKFVLAGIEEGVASHRRANPGIPEPPRLRYCKNIIERKIRNAKKDPGLRRASKRGFQKEAESLAKRFRYIASKLEAAKEHPDATEKLSTDFEEYRDALTVDATRLEKGEISTEAAEESVEDIPERLARRIADEIDYSLILEKLYEEIKNNSSIRDQQVIEETTAAALPDRLLEHFGIPTEWTI